MDFIVLLALISGAKVALPSIDIGTILEKYRSRVGQG